MTASTNIHLLLRTAARAVQAHQAGWAQRSGLELDASGWLSAREAAHNLVVPMSPAIEAAFGIAEDRALGGKWRAPHSSAVLAYNMFAAASTSPGAMNVFAQTLGLQPSAPSTKPVEFEVKHPTRWKGSPPHLDVEVSWPGLTMAVESKLSETFKAKRNAHHSLASYVEKWSADSSRWCGMTRLYSVAKKLFTEKKRLQILDAHQLVKLALGLRSAQLWGELEGTEEVVLVFLWFDASELVPRAKPACDLLRQELDWFRAEVGSDFDIRALSHQELFRAYQQELGDPPWIRWLEERYFSR